MKINKKSLSALVVFAVVLIAFSYNLFASSNSGGNSQSDASYNAGSLVVHFIDVGQGDSEFIEFPDGKCMLIDAGDDEHGNIVIESIESYGYCEIDYLIATHPHADHIGGMDEVVEHFDIGEIYMPKAVTSTKTYENLLNAISDKGLTIHTAKAGTTVSDCSYIEFLAPLSNDYDELNNYSAVVKVSYGETSFLFTGDAESISENEMLSNDIAALDCDVLKVGHHGSRYSSTSEFLTAVSPKYAVISCGSGNSYGHPHSEAIERLEACGADIFVTAESKTITMISNGKSIDVEVQ